MNLKKKIKGFFTLSRRANGGFTLVELIVVIAILAILAGIGIPAYSGYITKTNQQADVTLAKEIENALILGYYDGTVVPGDYVLVYPDADKNVKVEGEHVAEAMEAVFGANYTSLRLKYAEWDNSVVDVAATFMASTYNNQQESLLADVQTLTNAFNSFMNGQEEDATLEEIAGKNFTDFLDANDIDSGNPQAVANSLALYASYRTGNVVEDAFIDAWVRAETADTLINVQVGTDGSLGLVGGLAAYYARGEALVRYVDANKAPEATFVVDGETYTSLSAWFSAQPIDGDNKDEVKANINNLSTKTTGILYDYFPAQMNAYFYTPVSGEDTQAILDGRAYLATLGAIENSTPAMLKNLDSETMYNDGTMLNFLNSYIAAGTALSAESNAIMVRMQENGTPVSIPLYNLGLMN